MNATSDETWKPVIVITTAGVSSKKRDTSAVSLLSIFEVSPYHLGICGIDPPNDTSCKTLPASIDYP
jgi:hypothetical protein